MFSLMMPSTTWFLVVVFVIGLAALVKGADWLVDGASDLAKRLGVSDLMIGLTVVAFGTSMPEFIVNMASVSTNATDLAITNVLGSNTVNTLVILGCSALVYPIFAKKETVRFDVPLNIIGGILVLLFLRMRLGGEPMNGLSRMEGGLFLLVFACFLFYSIKSAKSVIPDSADSKTSIWRCILFVVIGLVSLVFGGELVVRSATAIAKQAGISESIIGLTIVALGTSLPELATSVMATFKRNSDIAIGNVVGSNVFNVFFILGTSALVRPLPAYQGIELDAFLVAFSATVVWLLLITNKKRSINRWGGALLLIVYAIYLSFRLGAWNNILNLIR